MDHDEHEEKTRDSFGDGFAEGMRLGADPRTRGIVFRVCAKYIPHAFAWFFVTMMIATMMGARLGPMASLGCIVASLALVKAWRVLVNGGYQLMHEAERAKPQPTMPEQVVYSFSLPDEWNAQWGERFMSLSEDQRNQIEERIRESFMALTERAYEARGSSGESTKE